jgi:hypothetical protein
MDGMRRNRTMRLCQHSENMSFKYAAGNMVEHTSSIPHKEMVTDVLASARFYTGPQESQISIRVPLANNTADHMMLLVNPDTRQLVIDVYRGERLQYSGIIAADMQKPMCPVFKH